MHACCQARSCMHIVRSTPPHKQKNSITNFRETMINPVSTIANCWNLIISLTMHTHTRKTDPWSYRLHGLFESCSPTTCLVLFTKWKDLREKRWHMHKDMLQDSDPEISTITLLRKTYLQNHVSWRHLSEGICDTSHMPCVLRVPLHRILRWLDLFRMIFPPSTTAPHKLIHNAKFFIL